MALAYGTFQRAELLLKCRQGGPTSIQPVADFLPSFSGQLFRLLQPSIELIQVNAKTQ